MATLGYSGVSAGDTSSGTNKISVSAAVAASDGVLTAGHARARLATTLSGGVGSKLVVFADTGSNRPGDRVAESNVVNVTGTTEAVWDYTFSGENQINIIEGTRYWIGIAWDDTSVNFVSRRFNTATDANGPRWERSGSVSPAWSFPTMPTSFGTPEGPFSGPVCAWVEYTEGLPPTINAGGDVTDWPVSTEFTRAAIVDDGGQTTTVEWEITAGPTGVGTTIDSDATLNWIPSQAGSYTITATATNPSGTDSDSFNITVADISVDTLRLYMTATDLSGSVSVPAMASYWNLGDTVAQDDCHQLSSVPEGVAEFRAATEVTASQPTFVLMGRWVTGPAQVAGTLLQDDVQVVMARGQSSADSDFVWSVGVRVITPAGTVRGEHFGVYFTFEWPVVADATECVAASLTASPTNITSVDVEVGDRVVVEIGYRTTNTLTTAQTGYIVFGGQGTPDLASGDAGGALNRPSWIDLPITEGLSFTNEAAPAVPAGAPGEIYDLSQWHLTTPRDSGDGDAEQINQPELETFEIAESAGGPTAWYVDDLGRIVAVADVDGYTTSGASGATRMELRQRDPNYDLTAFDPHTATQRMTAIIYPDATNITDGSNPRQEMIIWQIHGAGGTPPLLLAAEFDTVAQPRIRIFKDGPGVSNPISPYTLGDPVAIRCIIDDGQLDLYVISSDDPADLDSATPSTWATFAFADDVDWYFKVGAYNKTEIESGSNGYSVNKIGYLELNGVVLGPNLTPPEEDPFPMLAHFFGGM